MQPYNMAGGQALKRETALILAAVGLFTGVCGIQRFYVKETGMGIALLLTGGFCWIGQLLETIKLAQMSDQEFNQRYNGGMAALPP